MAEQRLAGLLAMEPGVLPTVFPADVTARLLHTVELRAAAPVTDFGSLPASISSEVEVIVSGWGCPPIDEAVLDAMPRLRAVVHAAGTVKGHVSPAVWDRGVLVSSAASVNAVPVAQYTLAMVLLAGKRVLHMADNYAEYSTGLAKLDEKGMGNHRRTVGVVGASRIGRLVLPMLAAQGFGTLVSDPTLDAEAAARLSPGGDTRLVDLDTLLRLSDVVTLHAPLLPSTRGMLDAPRLALMRDGATLVNTARGALVDTEALLAECHSGRIRAVLDVTDPEPLPAGHPLLGLPNVLVTPHIAGSIGTETELLGLHAVEEVERLSEGLPLVGRVHRHELENIA